MSRSRFIRTQCVSITLVGTLLGSFIGSSASATIRIGLLLPPEEAESVGLRQGVELAIEHANRSGQDPVELFIRGRVGQWGDDAIEAARMVLDDGVQGLLAPPGGAASHLTLQVAGRTAVPVISLCSDSSVTAAGIPWAIRIVPGTRDEAATLFTGLDSMRTAQTWLAFIPCDRAGREVAHDLRVAAESAGVKLTQTLEVPHGTSDFSTLYPTFPKEWPDGVLIWLDPEPAGHLAKYIRTIGFKGVVAGPSRLDSLSFRNAAGSAMEGMILPALDPQGRGNCGMSEFARSFQAQHGYPPDASAAMAYDGAGLLIELLRRTGDHPPHELIPLNRITAGVTGPLRFDRQGNRMVSLRLTMYHRGELVPLIPSEAAPPTINPSE
jgi:ABC-type branched-subunit amino acid transport system substrate-binding protein